MSKSPPDERSPTEYRTTGFFRTVRRKDSNFEIVFRNMSSDLAVTVAFNVPYEVAETLTKSMNDLIKKLEGRDFFAGCVPPRENPARRMVQPPTGNPLLEPPG